MLASTPNLLQMCSFDATKSTKGASKLRRDLINSEIANLRDLLPLPSSTRQRLSQLQLMALVCVYVRKANYFQYAFRKQDLFNHHHHLHHHHHLAHQQIPAANFGFSKALNGFLMMMTQNGKLLYISDNAAEYLGHSMEDLLIHGDSVYDIIEKQDHQTIQNELMRSSISSSSSASLSASSISSSSSSSPSSSTSPSSSLLSNNNHGGDSRIFLCRMNVSRNSRRQMRFGDQKVVLVQGHFVSYLPLCTRNEPVFLATCTPVAMPETRECVVHGSTNVFTSIHSMDMKFIHLDSNGEFHLGYRKNQIKNLSWYDIVHWDNLKEAHSKHRSIIQSEQERSCILLLRLQTRSMQWIWVHVVLQVKDNNENSAQPVIVCTNQVLSDKEAAVMQANSWLYQFYSLHSKMHYMHNSSALSTRSYANSCSESIRSISSVSEASTSLSSLISTKNVAKTTGHPLLSSSFHLTEASPSLAVHPTHPNNLTQSYYSNQNGLVSAFSPTTNASKINCFDAVTNGIHQYSPMLPQQYSPQAGSLPYQAVSTASTTILNHQTNLSALQIKEEESTNNQHLEQGQSSMTTRTKRQRSNNTSNNLHSHGNDEISNNGSSQHHQPSTKRSKGNSKKNQQQQSSKNSSIASNLLTTTTTTSSSSNSYHNNHYPHNLDQFSAYGQRNHSNSYHHHHHSQSFGSTTGTEFSSMINPGAYYGGSSMSSYHSNPHQMAAYTGHHPHGHFSYHQNKPFSFFDNSQHESANSINYHSQNVHNHISLTTSTSSSLSSSSTSSFSPLSSTIISHNHHRSSAQNDVIVSTALTSLSTVASSSPLAKRNGDLFGPTTDLLLINQNSNQNDRRELDKVRSPESITSATSDYGSMTSQSPPSSFEKPFSTLVSSPNIQDKTTTKVLIEKPIIHHSDHTDFVGIIFAEFQLTPYHLESI
ncbi:Lysosome-associated membrane glycoprotein 5 [Sarcoptes scabiei]|nr:Lysosome-associated membrane glycoprotein 5 [Sarcoptes scabiei]